LDEITITGPTRVGEVREGSVHTYEITPEEFGLQPAGIEELAGGDAPQNAATVRNILEGEKSARRDVVLMNAAAALVAAGHAEHLQKGAEFAAESIDSGRALGKLSALVEFTRSQSLQ
jgi:anthranilate phosphoribosyltransferase